jgi:AcrR family transcriptional regulator
LSEQKPAPRTRAARAASTKLRVLERSVDLFLAKGFAGSSTRELAAAGGVTEKTLFNIFGSKAELLRQGALHVIVGSDRPLLERSDFDAALHATDGPGLLAGFADAVTDVHLRAAPLGEVVRAAAAVDDAAHEFWTWGMAQEIRDCHSAAAALDRLGWLRSGLSVAEAGDTLSVLAGHDAYWRLTAQRSWPEQRYRRWLLDTASRQLLGPGPDTADR